MSSANLASLRQHRYVVLLALLLVSLATQSFDVRSGSNVLISDALHTIVGVTIFLVVFERPRERAAMGVALVITLAIGWGQDFVVGNRAYELSLAFHALLASFLWVAVWVIVRELFRTPAVGAENVLGAICGYLIAGHAWSAVNALAYLLEPGAYSISPEVHALLADWHGRMALFSYYSFAQTLTIGYADVTPVRAPATTLSLFAALFGVFYTAIVVAQLVGMARSRRGAGHGDE